MSYLETDLTGYRLTTAEILYHLPDHPSLLQSYVWQQYDSAPDLPRLNKFLDFWTDNIEGRLHTVRVANGGVFSACRNRLCRRAVDPALARPARKRSASYRPVQSATNTGRITWIHVRLAR